MSYTLNQEAIRFFMHSYFGISLEELKNPQKKESVIIKCAKRAYLDLNRTLNFAEKITGNMKSVDKERIENHGNFRDDICEIIKKQICENLLESTQENFDGKHKSACEEICTAARESESLAVIEHAKEHENEKNEKLYYGQAQKWINMTLKYMWLTDLWKDKFDALLPVLHIPVDSFIIESIWHEGFEENKNGWLNKADVNNLSIVLPCENDRRQYKYSSEKVVPWSKWNYVDYEKFQKKLREWCKNKDIYPLIWEGRAWIEIANKRSSK